MRSRGSSRSSNGTIRPPWPSARRRWRRSSPTRSRPSSGSPARPASASRRCSARSPRRSRPARTAASRSSPSIPSSAVTGGALLGDRTRIRVPEGRVFIRSQASQAESGGLAPTTYPVVRVAAAPVRPGAGRDARGGAVGGRHPPRRRRHVPAAAAARGRQRPAPEGGPDGGARRDRRDEVRRRRSGAPRARRPARARSAWRGRARPSRCTPSAPARAPASTSWPPPSLRPRQVPEQPHDDWFVTRAVRTAHGRLGAARLAEHGPGSGGSLDERLAEALARSSPSSA